MKLYPRAYRDLDGIYNYIVCTLLGPTTASKMIDELENAIVSLETLPECGVIRRVGAYANQGYRPIASQKLHHYLPCFKATEGSSYHNS